MTQSNMSALLTRATLMKSLAAFVAFLIVLLGPFRAGWTQSQTDFPNYYTAAVAVGHHLPLRDYYDWTWFARQMNYAGLGLQFASYTPQTPLTMLPMVPLATFPVQRAKQIWLTFNLLFLALTVWLLSRISRFHFMDIWLLTFCGHFALRTNFLYGQYYIFLLFLMTLAFYLLHREQSAWSGALSGVAFALKLYGGPFLLYFAARREWKALLNMLLMTVVLLSLAIALFGVSDIHYYATQILPRTLEGGSIDPYAPLVPTFSTMLRYYFMREAELNPHPLWHAPSLFFFLRAFLSLSVVVFLVFQAATRCNTARRDFALFMIGALLLSTSIASYSFILLLLPTILLMEEATHKQSILLIICYVLLTLPLHPVALFPKVWLLFTLLIVAGWPALRCRLRPLPALAAVFALALFAVGDAILRLRSYYAEPPQRFQRLAPEEGAMFSSFPAISRAGLFYQSMGTDRYVLRWLHDGKNEVLSFPGFAFHPRVAPDGQSIDFELVANRTSMMMHFDPITRITIPLPVAVPSDEEVSALSPDGKWIVFEDTQHAPVQIWLRDTVTDQAHRLTGGKCNNSAPAWDLDSKSIVFASDCDHAFGLPSLYRAPIPSP